MTLREFLLKKYPPSKWMDCPIHKRHWKNIEEYAKIYHKKQLEKIKDNDRTR